MSKHTETPWELDGNGHIYGGLTKGCGIRTATPYSEVDAAFIVKACNEYHPLTRIVKALVEKLDADVWFLETAKNEGICVESIKEIIKQAEGD